MERKRQKAKVKRQKVKGKSGSVRFAIFEWHLGVLRMTAVVRVVGGGEREYGWGVAGAAALEF